MSPSTPKSDDRDAGRDPSSPGRVAPAPPVDQQPSRRRTGRNGSWTARFGALVLAVLAVVGLVALAGKVISLPDLNPFDARTTDRSQPVLLTSVRDLARFSAAQGNFEVVIDLQDDRKFVPDFLLNDRTLFVAAGSVEAYVDFAKIGKGEITVKDDKSVVITLPAPTLGEAHLDLDNSHVFSEQRGLVNRVQDALGSDPDGQKKVYSEAESRIAKAADDADLRQRAEDNTTKTLTGLLRSLGYTDVTVSYTRPAL